MSVEPIRLDELSPTAVPSLLHFIAVMKDGMATKMTVGQLLSLIVGVAPEALDTIYELAVAYEANSDLITLLEAAVAAKADAAATTSALASKASLTGIETLTNKTLTTPTLILKQSTGPAPTADGAIEWDSDDEAIVIGDGSGQKIFRKSGLTISASQATTSGSSKTFSSIPSWVTQIIISFVGVSTNGTASVFAQIGDSGGLETTGYLSSGFGTGGGTIANTQFTTGFGIRYNAATIALHGSMILTLSDPANNTWACSYNLSDGAGGAILGGGGTKSLSAPLDRLAIVTTDTFDAGLVSIAYQ